MGETTVARWERVRARYETGGVTVAGLAAEEGVNEATIYARARRKGWARRRAALSDAERRAVWRRRVAQQLSSLAEELGAALAASCADITKGESADDHDDPEARDTGCDGRGRTERLEAVERRVRALQSLLRSVREIERLGEPKGGPGAGEAAQTADRTGDDADDPYAVLRGELERRLDRLVAGG